MPKTNPIIIAIAGAKGGVGKSMVCSNLAVQFAQAGLQTTLLDLDLGAANQHTLFGISRSCRDWTEWLLQTPSPLQDYQAVVTQKNLTLLPACGYHPGIAETLLAHQNKLIEAIKMLPSEIVLIDLGAGTHKSTLDFFTFADLKILVTTTESTSLLNNFEFLKNAIYQSFYRVCSHDEKMLHVLKNFQQQPKVRVADWIEQVKMLNSFTGEVLNEICLNFNVSVIFNQVRKIEEVHHALRLKNIVFQHLNLNLHYPGFIFFSEEIVASMQKKLPISYISPKSIVAQIFKRIAQQLMKDCFNPEELKQTTLSLSQIQQDFHKNRVERKKAHHFL